MRPNRHRCIGAVIILVGLLGFSASSIGGMMMGRDGMKTMLNGMTDGQLPPGIDPAEIFLVPGCTRRMNSLAWSRA